MFETLTISVILLFERTAFMLVGRLSNQLTTSVIPVMLGGHSELDPPLPISNRAVKRFCANDSILLVCESRSLPSFYLENPCYSNVVGVFALRARVM